MIRLIPSQVGYPFSINFNDQLLHCNEICTSLLSPLKNLMALF